MSKAIDHRITAEWVILGETGDEGGIAIELVGWGPYGEWKDSEDAHGTAERIVACLNACKGIASPGDLPVLLEHLRDFVDEHKHSPPGDVFGDVARLFRALLGNLNREVPRAT